MLSHRFTKPQMLYASTALADCRLALLVLIHHDRPTPPSCRFACAHLRSTMVDLRDVPACSNRVAQSTRSARPN